MIIDLFSSVNFISKFSDTEKSHHKESSGQMIEKIMAIVCAFLFLLCVALIVDSITNNTPLRDWIAFVGVAIYAVIGFVQNYKRTR